MSDARNVDADRPGFMPAGSDPTLDWMIHDVARRCHAVLDALHTNGSAASAADAAAGSTSMSAVRLGDAAITLRGAADDLATVVELIEGPVVTDGTDQAMPAFGLSFKRDNPDTTP